MMFPGSIEWFPVVDEQGNTIGEAPRHVCHDGKSMLLHPVIHLYLFNSGGKLFLQKRSMMKDIQPGKWDTSVGGHVAPGESAEDAVKRETEEELGLKGLSMMFEFRYIWQSNRERELVSSFSAISDDIPVINVEEIDEGRFWDISEIRESLGKDLFTPNFEYEFGLHDSNANGLIQRMKGNSQL